MAEAVEVVSGGLFKPPEVIHPCSWCQCSNGHRWPPDLIVAKCPGCGGPYLAIRQMACPFCNEPVLTLSLRTDFVPGGSGPVPRCRGAKVFGETLDQVLERRGHVEAAESFKDFMTKESEEHGKNPGGQSSGS